MGLDIYFCTDKDDELEETDEQDKLHSLSREFCNLIFRRSVIKHEPELEQISKITDMDISFIYQMVDYPNDEFLENQLEFAEDEKEKQEILRTTEKQRAEVANNLNSVLVKINSLIEKLSKIEDLNKLLLPTNYDTLNAAYYFSDFTIDKGEGYIKNNFGQDLRNFKRFLEFAKENGAKTVWLIFG